MTLTKVNSTRLNLFQLNFPCLTKDLVTLTQSLSCQWKLNHINALGLQVGSSVSASGQYGAFSASLKVDVSKLKTSSADTAKFTENTVKFTSGGPDMPEPIKLNLKPIHNAVEDSFFIVLDRKYRCENLAQRKGNLKRILQEYPRIKHVSEPQGMISHDALKILKTSHAVMAHRSSAPGVTATCVLNEE